MDTLTAAWNYPKEDRADPWDLVECTSLSQNNSHLARYALSFFYYHSYDYYSGDDKVNYFRHLATRVEEMLREHLDNDPKTLVKTTQWMMGAETNDHWNVPEVKLVQIERRRKVE